MKELGPILIDNKPIKYSTIVPLIGGMTIANRDATGVDPTFMVSYDAFESNDSHCVNYFGNVPYYVIDNETNRINNVENKIFENVDFVSAVCPCAGLSMLNSNNGASNKARGSDAIQNEWMYKSAKFVLEYVRPKVFWGENAPGLYTKMGEGVVENLRKIGEKNGYSFSMIKTNTFLHGIPQNRIRTFYFFWKDSEAPILGYHKTDSPHLKEYLEQMPQGLSLMDVGFGLGDLKENPWINFIKNKGWSIKDAIESPAITILQLILREGWLDEAIQWSESINESMNKICKHVKNKLLDDKGFWDSTPLIFNEATNALIAKNAGIVHPNGERGITVREAMWLMGLPHDFEFIEGNHWNHICQNVPVKTATDWTYEVIRFLKGEIQDYGGSFVKQNNISQSVDYTEKKVKGISLF